MNFPVWDQVIGRNTLGTQKNFPVWDQVIGQNSLVTQKNIPVFWTTQKNLPVFPYIYLGAQINLCRALGHTPKGSIVAVSTPLGDYRFGVRSIIGARRHGQ
jgi:hypothetical protein